MSLGRLWITRTNQDLGIDSSAIRTVMHSTTALENIEETTPSDVFNHDKLTRNAAGKFL